jgi:fatty aldehyde-generating acyl-ACP reductase
MTYLTSQAPWFVFLIHARDVQDLFQVRGSTLIAEHSVDEDEFRDKMCTMPPTVLGQVTFGLGPVTGELIGVVRMPGQLLRPDGRRSISEAVHVAATRGAKVIGLGALTAPATRGGLTLVPELPKGVTLTTGNAFTAAIACANVAEAAQATGLGDAATVAVVGCHGSVGTAASRLLAARGTDLLLIGRTVTRVERELPDLVTRARVSAELRDLVNADIVLLLTSDPSAKLVPGLVRPGTVVIDLAHPVNIEPAQYQDFLNRGVAVAQGGLVEIPGYRSEVDFRLPSRRAALACLAETYLFAREGIREHSVGPASAELAAELALLATAYGIRPWPLGLTATEPSVVVAR